MAGTKYATDGFRRISRLGPQVQLRLFGFVAVLVCGGLLLAWMARSAWAQLDHLQKEHAAVSGESFYLAVTLRGSVRSLNEKLLQFGHSPDPQARDDFLRESADLKGWLVTNRMHLAELAKLPLMKQLLIDDFDLLDKIQAQYAGYLHEAADLLAVTNAASGAHSFEARYNRIRGASRDLLALSDDLVKAQREDFSSFLAETQGNLIDHQRLLKLTLTLIVVLAGALAVMVYRGLIAPLRLGLTQSKTIIERQEKLASLGVLASGVAHEIRNPLTAIKFRLFSIKKAVPGLAQNEDVQLVANELNRLERIVKDFLGFARPSDPEMRTIPAASILQDVSALMKGQLERSGVRLAVESGPGAWLHADAQQLKQVMINLVQNAAEASGPAGRITLSVRVETTELEGRPKPLVILSVADSGKGILPAVEARLFDPFFTTKDGGTGLGLAIAARIVEKHGGMLRYETEVNRGTTFEVVLPGVEYETTQPAVDRR